MSNIRAIVTIAVPAVTAILGLIWYFGRKKQPAPKRLVDPPDKQRKQSQGTGGGNSAQVEIDASASKTDVLNGQTGKGSTNVPEDYVSSTNLKKSSVECLPTDKGDNTSSVTPSTESRLIAVNEEGVEKIEDLKVTNKQDVIQECVINPSFIKSCSYEKPLEVNNEAHVEDVTAEAAVQLQAVEEPVISHTLVGSAFTAPEHSSPASEQTSIADKSQDTNDINRSPSPSSLKMAIDSEENQLPDQAVTPDKLSSDVEHECSSETESQILQQVDQLKGSWHEDYPEDMEDLCEIVSTDSHDQSCENVQTSLEKSPVTAQKADNISILEKQESDSCSSKNLSPFNSKANKQLEKQQLSRSSRTGSESEKVNENSHSDSSSNCDNLSEASNDSGKGGSVQENTNTSPPDEDRLFEFNIPSDMCGLFIGTRGKTIKMISQQSGTKIRLQNNPYTRDFQICLVEGSQSGIEAACNIIKRKFPAIKFPGMDLTPAANPVIMPEIMQLSLPEGVSVDIVVSSIVDAGRLFVQQPTHPTYPSLERLNTFMNQCYMQEGAVPDIPRPIESGVICAAPMLNGWYRAQIMAVHDDCDECDIKYVDYGGYSRVSSSLLKQIRSDFMTLPFEAVECFLANITPLENEQYFSTEAAVVLEELTQGKLLQGQVVGRAEDGIPYVHVYQILGANSAVLVNREMVNRGVVRWIELLE